MILTDVYSAEAVAFVRTNDASNTMQFAGAPFFPNKRKSGGDLKWYRAHRGLGIALKASTYDSLATIRPRGGFQAVNEEMPLFRESMKISENDLREIRRAKDRNDRYLNEALDHIYNDVNELINGAEISTERMRMQLMAPVNGNVKIVIGMVDNTLYEYNYDADGKWKTNHYMELTGTDTWDNADKAKPLNDIHEATTYLSSIGVSPAFAMMTTKTFNYLLESDQMKNALITSSNAVVDFLDTASGKDIFRRKTGLSTIINDKKYADNDADNTQRNFFPDDYVTIIGTGILGNTYYGETPEEGSLMDDPTVDVSVLPSGIAVAVQKKYGPPVEYSTTASQIVLPSFEGMDSIYVIKVK